MSRVANRPVLSPQQGDLARLLETERRLEVRVTEARAQAEALVARARLNAEERETALAAELEAGERSLTQALEVERRRREADIAAAAQLEVEAYEGIPADRVAAVARALAERLIEQDAAR